MDITIPLKGDHPTLGMQFKMCPYRNKLQLQNMALSTPGSRVPKWRSLLRHAYLLTCEHQPIHSDNDLLEALAQAKHKGTINVKFTFAVDKSHGLHPHQGVPQLYFDQLNVIASHIQAIDEQRRQNQAVVHTLDAPSITPVMPAPPPAPDRDPIMNLPPPEPPPLSSTEPSKNPSEQTIEQPQFFTLSQLKKRDQIGQTGNNPDLKCSTSIMNKACSVNLNHYQEIPMLFICYGYFY